MLGAAALAAVCAVTGGGLAVALSGRGAAPSGGATAARSTPSPTATATAPAPAGTVAEAVPAAKAFVESHRGLLFKRDVPVTALDDTAFRAKLLGGQSGGQSSSGGIDDTARELRALHLISGGVNLGSAAQQALGAGVVGFYDPRSKQLYVRGVKPTPYVREVIVHELTHALQDQWFGLDRPELRRAADESQEAFTSLIEGDAVRIENQFVASLSPADQAAARQAKAAVGGSLPTGIPTVLLQLIGFPYEFGPNFCAAVVLARGQAGLDDAFRHPPTTTAEIMQPERYLGGNHVTAVGYPISGGTEFDRGVFGEEGFLILFEHQAEAGTITATEAVQATRAWAGDRYVAWSVGSTACMRVTVVALPGEGPALAAALRAEEAATPGVTGSVSTTGPTTITFCS